MRRVALLVLLWASASPAADEDTLIAQGKDLVSLRRYGEGEKTFRRALELAPGHPEARYGAAYCAHQQGRLTAALKDYEQVLKLTYLTPALRPFHTLSLARVGEIHLARRKYGLAEQVYRQGVKNDPGNAELRYGLGVALRGMGRNEPALQEFEETLKISPQHPAARIGKASIFYELGNVPEAFKLLEESVKLAPASPLPYGVMSSFYQDLKRPHEQHLTLGHYYFYSGDLTRAANEYRTAQSIKETAETHHLLGVAYLQLSRPAEAEKQLREALASKIKPADVTWAQLARALSDQGRLAEAEQALDKATGLNKTATAYQVQRGLLRIRQGRHEDAEREARKALEREPDNPSALKCLGDALSARGRMRDAIDAYEQALAKDPSLTDAYVNLGWAYEVTSDLVAAIRNYELFLKSSPGAEEAKAVREQIAKLRKRPRQRS